MPRNGNTLHRYELRLFSRASTLFQSLEKWGTSNSSWLFMRTISVIYGVHNRSHSLKIRRKAMIRGRKTLAVCETGKKMMKWLRPVYVMAHFVERDFFTLFTAVGGFYSSAWLSDPSCMRSDMKMRWAPQNGGTEIEDFAARCGRNITRRCSRNVLSALVSLSSSK